MDDLYFQKIIEEREFSFNSFILEYLDERVIYEHKLTIPQYLYIYDHTHRKMVDFIGKIESFESDFEIVAEKLGVNKQLGVTNSSKRFCSEHDASAEAIEELKYLYKNDFKLFGYK